MNALSNSFDLYTIFIATNVAYLCLGLWRELTVRRLKDELLASEIEVASEREARTKLIARNSIAKKYHLSDEDIVLICVGLGLLADQQGPQWRTRVDSLSFQLQVSVPSNRLRVAEAALESQFGPAAP